MIRLYEVYSSNLIEYWYNLRIEIIALATINGQWGVTDV